LNVWVGIRAIWDLVTRRISSSLFPENIGPQMTSIHPVWARLNTGREPSGGGARHARTTSIGNSQVAQMM